MGSRYERSFYEPLSPVSSNGRASAHYCDVQPRAPVMPYRTLPTLYSTTPSSPHHGLITPPLSYDGAVNPLLSASPTIVRYDLKNKPSTIRMSSSVCPSTFPTTQPASIPSHSTIYIECEITGQVIPIHNDSSTHGVTCADVFMQLHSHFSRPLSPTELQHVPEPQRSAIQAAFSRRSARQHDPTMRMVDFLQGHTAFKRLIPKRGSRSGIPTWLLQTTT